MSTLFFHSKGFFLAAFLALAVLCSVAPQSASAMNSSSTVSFQFLKYVDLRGTKVIPEPTSEGVAPLFSFHLVGNNGFSGTFRHEETTELAPGTYTLTESGPEGYMLDVWAGNCVEAGQPDDGPSTTFVVDSSDQGGLMGCQIYNKVDPDYVPGGTTTPTNGTLTVNKVIVNDNGGTVSAFSAFSFAVNGGTSTAFAANGSNALSLPAGTYSIVENAAVGYTATYSNCSNINLTSGGSATCTITNNDITPPAPGTTGTLVVTKNIVGTTTPFTGFSFNVNGGASTTFEVDGSNSLTLATGTYSVVETPVAGYSTAYSGCSGTIAAGATSTCIITNTLVTGGGGNDRLYKVEGVVWNDADSDDVFDEEEVKLTGWAVSISNGSTVMGTTTDETGYYYFMVPAGSWTITETVQNEWSQTFPNNGSHTVTVPGLEVTSFMSRVLALFISTAHAQAPQVFGPFNFGNVFVGGGSNNNGGGGNGGGSSSGGGSSKSSGTKVSKNNGEVKGASDTFVTGPGIKKPTGAPNTGAGGSAVPSSGASMLILSLFGLAIGSLMLRRNTRADN